MFSVFFASIVLTLPILIPLFGPALLATLARFVGIYLSRKTADRRSQIVELSEKDEKELAKADVKRRKSDESWESVDHAINSDIVKDETWDGIIGFFHPFWYVCVFWSEHSQNADIASVMPVVEERESCGLP